MNSKKRLLTYGATSLLITCLVVSVLQLPALAKGDLGDIIKDKPGTGRKLLLFLNLIAEAIGGFLVFIINQITGVKLSNMVMPLGYLSELTLFLMAIEILEGAKKVIWLIILAGWGLIAVRVVTDVLQANPA